MIPVITGRGTHCKSMESNNWGTQITLLGPQSDGLAEWWVQDTAVEEATYNKELSTNHLQLNV